MGWRILRRGIIPLILILAAFTYWKLHPGAPRFVSVGHVAERNVTLWNALAQVKQPLAVLHYGDRVEIMREEGTTAEVRTASGVVGWMTNSHQMMNSELWDESAALLARARKMPVQAVGRTNTISNVHIEPGRNSQRVFQFQRGTPVVILERAAADVPQDENASPANHQNPKQQEDWDLVLRSGETLPSEGIPDSAQNSTSPESQATSDSVSGGPGYLQSNVSASGLPAAPIAGWVLARFIDLDLPGPIRDYAGASDLHVQAYFVLNRVPNGSGGEAPQYLVAATRGGGGQPCDFTVLRVYTWSATQNRYETAYTESNICGSMPIHVSQSPSGPEFRFAEAGNSGGERTYVMRQTMVRRLRSKDERRDKHR
ncbi:MAG TPA: hypothetical protein VNI36_13750 [Candidatus Dormibacteraeota bacterium]|nr:hypothetical protein [Candidatus Dormibacteraeota bacterium]